MIPTMVTQIFNINKKAFKPYKLWKVYILYVVVFFRKSDRFENSFWWKIYLESWNNLKES